MKTNKLEEYLDLRVSRYNDLMEQHQGDLVWKLIAAETVILAEFHGYPVDRDVCDVPEIRSDLLSELSDYIKIHQIRKKVSEEVRNGEFEFDDNKSRDDFIEMISHFVMRVSDK